MQYPVIITCTPQEKAQIKMFCRLIDETISEFALYSMQNEIDYQMRKWDEKQKKQLSALTRSVKRRK